MEPSEWEQIKVTEDPVHFVQLLEDPRRAEPQVQERIPEQGLAPRVSVCGLVPRFLVEGAPAPTEPRPQQIHERVVLKQLSEDSLRTEELGICSAELRLLSPAGAVPTPARFRRIRPRKLREIIPLLPPAPPLLLRPPASLIVLPPFHRVRQNLQLQPLNGLSISK